MMTYLVSVFTYNMRHNSIILFYLLMLACPYMILLKTQTSSVCCILLYTISLSILRSLDKIHFMIFLIEMNTCTLFTRYEIKIKKRIERSINFSRFFHISEKPLYWKTAEQFHLQLTVPLGASTRYPIRTKVCVDRKTPNIPFPMFIWGLGARYIKLFTPFITPSHFPSFMQSIQALSWILFYQWDRTISIKWIQSRCPFLPTMKSSIQPTCRNTYGCWNLSVASNAFHFSRRLCLTRSIELV